VFPERTRELRVEVDLIAEMAVLNPFDFFLTPYAEQVPFQYEEHRGGRAGAVPGEAARDAFVRPISWPHCAHQTRTIDFLGGAEPARGRRHSLSDPQWSPGVQSPNTRCKTPPVPAADSGWLLVQLLRHLGLAARFVSGYLIQLTSDVKSLDGPVGPAADFTDCTPGARCIYPGGLDRAGSDLGTAGRRRPYPACLYA